jgi:hypothetical protein
MESFHLAWNRLSSCATQQGVSLANQGGGTPTDEAVPRSALPVTAPNSLQLLYSSGLQKEKAVNENNLREDPDALDATVQFVFEVERTTASICPTASLSNQALLLLAQNDTK